jgi:hypothetical protein
MTRRLGSVWNTLFAATLLFTQVSCGDTGLSNASNLGDLVLEVRSSRSLVQVGESVQVQFTVRNTGKQSVVLESMKLPVMDLNVRPAYSDHIITSWSAQNPDKVLHRIEWKPGESKTLELVWTATQETFSHQIFFTGFLTQNTGPGHATGVTLCVGYRDCR